MPPSKRPLAHLTPVVTDLDMANRPSALPVRALGWLVRRWARWLRLPLLSAVLPPPPPRSWDQGTPRQRCEKRHAGQASRRRGSGATIYFLDAASPERALAEGTRMEVLSAGPAGEAVITELSLPIADTDGLAA
jgi:hypothetical protein